jgi:hypothetical protein
MIAAYLSSCAPQRMVNTSLRCHGLSLARPKSTRIRGRLPYDGVTLKGSIRQHEATQQTWSRKESDTVGRFAA